MTPLEASELIKNLDPIARSNMQYIVQNKTAEELAALLKKAQDNKVDPDTLKFMEAALTTRLFGDALNKGVLAQ